MLNTAPSTKSRSLLQVALHLARRGISFAEDFQHLGIPTNIFSAYPPPDMIEIDRALLDIPLCGHRNEASKLTEALQSTVDVAYLLVERLSDPRQIKLRAIAKRMGMSVRTLQRRLKYCGIDFEELLDETRRSEAIRLITQGRYSMTDIAYLIGYSDPAHFTRAFKRWTGAPPSRFSNHLHHVAGPRLTVR